MSLVLPRRLSSSLAQTADFGRQVFNFAADVLAFLTAVKTEVTRLDTEDASLQAQIDDLADNGTAPLAHASTHLPGGTDALTTAAAGTITPGDSAAAGSAASFARSDHRHSIAAFGTTAGTFAQGNDSRLSDDRTASGLRSASTVVSVSAATAPTAGKVLTATGTTA